MFSGDYGGGISLDDLDVRLDWNVLIIEFQWSPKFGYISAQCSPVEFHIQGE